MKVVIFIIIALATMSCLKPGENNYYIRASARVNITQTHIPETATINESTNLLAVAEASNGCWSNLNFTLTKNSDFDYLLEAYGNYESFGTCTDIKVYGDTLIAFKPTKAGIYIFHVLKKENETEVDSMIVGGS